MLDTRQGTLLDRLPSLGSEPYGQEYAEFWMKSAATPGYAFREAVVRQNVPPRTTTFAKPLR